MFVRKTYEQRTKTKKRETEQETEFKNKRKNFNKKKHHSLLRFEKHGGNCVTGR